MRVRLRTALLIVAAIGLLCWPAARVTTWYLRRPTYRSLAEYHDIKALSLADRVNTEAYLHRIASYYLRLLLAHPEIDVHREAPDYVRSGAFHPFSGPRSDWPATVEAHRVFLDRLSRNVAYHSRMSQGYRRAFAAPWWGIPSEAPPPEAASRSADRRSGPIKGRVWRRLREGVGSVPP